MMNKTVVPGLSAVLFAAGVLCAQAPKPLTSVALYKVAPEKVDAFVAKGKTIAPVLDQLLAAGVVTAYGIDVDLLHVPGATNVALWMDVPNFAALGQLEKAIETFGRANPATMQELRGLADGPSHHDMVVRNLESKSKPAAAGSMPVSDFDQINIKPGRMGDYLELFRKYEKPVLEKLVDDGVIIGYSLGTEAVHTEKPGMVWTIVTMTDLGAKDKVNAAFRAANEKVPEAERNLVEKMYDEVTEPGSHRDSLAVSVLYKAK
jgi:hypothetical protein